MMSNIHTDICFFFVPLRSLFFIFIILIENFSLVFFLNQPKVHVQFDYPVVVDNQDYQQDKE
jgi:hypothetical protein